MMSLKKKIHLLFHVVIVLTGFMAASPSQEIDKRVRVELFYEPGCPECEVIEADVLVPLQDQYGSLVQIIKRPTDLEENHLALARYQEESNSFENEPVFLVIQGRILLSGENAIREQWFDALNDSLQTLMAGWHSPPEKPAEPTDALYQKRISRFSIPGVCTAGLIDGLNPCAFATLLFLVSLLLVFRADRGRIILTGTGFLLATFFTYFAIGLGLMKTLDFLNRIRQWERGFEGSMIVLLLLFAFLSFRDAWRLKKKPDARMLLALPQSLQRRIHLILRKRLGSSLVFMGAFAAGTSVTLVETLCTGQVYLPTLIWIIRHGETKIHALRYLFLYNVSFTLPAVVVFLFALKGLTSETLLNIGKRNAPLAKVLMGLFFIILAAFFLILM